MSFIIFAESLTSKSRNGSFRKKNRFSIAVVQNVRKDKEEDTESTWVILILLINVPN
jgi:hypothetical protein